MTGCVTRRRAEAHCQLRSPSPSQDPTRTNVIKGTAIVWIESSSQKEYSLAH